MKNSPDGAASFETGGDRVIWRGDGETIVVEPWGENSARVRSSIMSDVVDTDWALLDQPRADCHITIDGEDAKLTVGKLTVRLRSESPYGYQTGYGEHSCSISFYNQRGELLLAEHSSAGALKIRARHFQSQLGGDFRLVASFEPNPGETLVGMGQYQQDILDLKGCTLELAHRNSQVSVPFLLSSKGYGFLWHNPAIGRATFAANRTEWVAESTKQLDYWITAGDNPAEISGSYARATGHVPMMPEWGLGFWQSKLRYWNQGQLLEVARGYKERNLPIDVIVADFFHWPKMGDFRFEEVFWPDPAAMVAELRELGIQLVVSVWPQISTESENYSTMKKNNFLVKSERGIDVHMQFEGPSAFFDATNPAARQFVWDVCRRNYAAHGVRGFWLDEAEPEFGVYDYDNYRYAAGPTIQVGNIYPQNFSRAFFDGQRADGQTDIVNLVRAGWAGSQRYGALVWSGDIHSDFDTLRRQITAGIHMGAAGIPWFTTDIGGFGGGKSADPSFHELLVRWFQFGTFCPVMRLHGDRHPGTAVTAADGSVRLPTGASNEVWSYGDDVYQILRACLELRERLRPYIREVMRSAHEDGQPVMRGLFHEFPEDPIAWTISEQFMFGPDLLVAPIVEAQVDSRRVYLPAGSSWLEAATGRMHHGGQIIIAEAPLHVIPVFARDGRQADAIRLFGETD